MENIHEYTVDWIIQHVMREDGFHCVIWGYGKTTADDTEEPAENIPKHFIYRYW